MATSVTVNFIQIFTAGLDPWHVVDTCDVFCSQPDLLQGKSCKVSEDLKREFLSSLN